MKKFNLKLFSEIGSKDSMRRGTTTPTRSSIRPTKNVQSTFQKNSGTLTITGNYLQKGPLNVITVIVISQINYHFWAVLASPDRWRAGLFNWKGRLVDVIICFLRSDKIWPSTIWNNMDLSAFLEVCYRPHRGSEQLLLLAKIDPTSGYGDRKHQKSW
jgi:hypothetical protein